MVRLMNKDETQGNLSYFPLDKRKRESSDNDPGAAMDDASVSGDVLLKTLEEPFESTGRSRRIAHLREKVLAGTYHIPALDLAERMIDGDNF